MTTLIRVSALIRLFSTGEEPEYMNFLEDDRSIKSSPIIRVPPSTSTRPPIKHVAVEDYYYYDSEDGSNINPQQSALTAPDQEYDYEYYDNDGPAKRKRALDFKKYLHGMTTPMGFEGK